jgi:hypothetical protein
MAMLSRSTRRGDPLVMRTPVLERYVEVLLDPRLAGLESIRIGTKAVSYWPYRFVTDPDADDLMRLFERIVAAGKHPAEIFRDAYKQVSGLARTVRGPIMSAEPGKVCVDGMADICGERVFVLHFVQARNLDLVNQPFFARFDPTATWLTDLTPALGAIRFPYEPGS